MLHTNLNMDNMNRSNSAIIILIGLLFSVALFTDVNARPVNSGSNPKLSYITAIPASVENGTALPRRNIDTTKVKKETTKFSFSEVENDEAREYLGTMKNGEITSLYINRIQIQSENFGKYKALIEKRIKANEAGIQKKQIELNEQPKETEKEAKLRRQEMQKNETELRQQQNAVKKGAEAVKQTQGKIDKDAKPGREEILKKEAELKQQQIEAEKKEKELKQLDKELTDSEKVFENFIRDVKQLLIESGIKDINDDYSLILNSKKLVINSKIMPDNLRDKAKKLYQKHYKADIGDQTLLRKAKI